MMVTGSQAGRRKIKMAIRLATDCHAERERGEEEGNKDILL
jgi:hypothetical protein